MTNIQIPRSTAQAAIDALQWFASDIPTPKTLADQKRAEDLDSLLEALHAALSSAQVEPEPVAWTGWQQHPWSAALGHVRTLSFLQGEGYEEVPLYAAPPPSPAEPDNWQQYAKDGETAQAVIERHRGEQDALLTLLAKARQQASPAEPPETLSDERIEELSMPYIERSAEPACPGCGASVLYECAYCGAGNYPPDTKVPPSEVRP